MEPYLLHPWSRAGFRAVLPCSRIKILIFRDALKRKILSLEKSSSVDQLTGLGNRRFALQKLKETIRYCERRAGVVQLVMLEIHPWDYIKKTISTSNTSEPGKKRWECNYKPSCAR